MPGGGAACWPIAATRRETIPPSMGGVLAPLWSPAARSPSLLSQPLPLSPAPLPPLRACRACYELSVASSW